MKFFYRNWGKKTKQSDSDWRTYKTSSAHVKEAICLYGLSYFTFEVLQVYSSRGGVVAGEAETLWAANIFHNKDGDGNRIYLNRHIGGVKFVPSERMSEETRQKISVGNTGKVRTPEQVEEHSRMLKEMYATGCLQPWNKGVPMTEDAKENLRLLNTGRKASQDTKDKISASQKGKPKLTLRGKPSSTKGKPLTDAHKAKLSAAKTGKSANNKNLKEANPLATCSVCGKLARKSDITRYHKHESKEQP